MTSGAASEATLDEAARRAFEAAWRAGRPEPIERFLPSPDNPQYLATLAELVQIELEFSWKAWRPSPDDTTPSTRPTPLEGYLARFPRLHEPSPLRQILEQEYRVRQQYGDRPELDEYRRRFPEVASTLESLSLPADLRKPPEAPPQISGYEVLGSLGAGGMGIVYKARQVNLDRMVALKMVRAGAGADPEELARFHREAEAAARLQHPNIVQIFEVGQQGGLPYCALEYVPGGSLAEQIAGTPQPARQAAQLVEALARAMHHAHQQGIVHRDLKPANVLLARSPGVLPVEDRPQAGRPCYEPKISDFGLAKRLDLDRGLTQTGAVMGTPSYMAPEQAAGKNRQVGPAADIYALGAILYEMLTGRPPFKGETATDTLLQVLAGDPVPPRRLQPRCPRDLETICLKCLQKEPGQRYPSAAALADDCTAFLKGEPIKARPPGLLERLAKWMRRRPATAALLGVSLTAALTLLGGGVAYHLRVLSVLQEVQKEQARTAAEAEKKRQQLVWRSLDSAWRQVDAGDTLGSLPWFAEALRLDQGDPEREQPQRLRLASLLRQSPRLVQVLVHDGPVRSAVFSADGQRVLTASLDHTARLWDVSTGQPMTPPLQHDGPVVHAAFSPDGRRVVTASYDHSARVWDAATGQPLTDPLQHSQFVNHAVFSPDGRRLITASGDWTAFWGSGEARVWDAGSGKLLAGPLGKESVLHGAWSPDGHRAVLTCLNGWARVWDENRDPPLGDLPTAMLGPRPGKVIRYGEFSPDGRRLLVPFGPSAQVQDLAAPNSVPQTLGTSTVKHAAFSPDGRRIVTAGDDGGLRLWDAATGKEVAPPLFHGRPLHDAAFSPDGSRLLTISDDYHVWVWEVAGRRLLAPPLQHGSALHQAVFSPDGRRLLTAGEDHTVRIWELTANSPALQPLPGPPSRASFGPGGRRLLLVGPKDTARVWDPVAGQFLTPPLPQSNRAGPLPLFSPDGSRVLTSSWDTQQRQEMVQAWDAATGQALGPALAHRQQLSGAAFSPDGSRLITATTGSFDRKVKPAARVWDLASGNPLTPLLEHDQKVVSVAFSPDGHRVLTVSGDVGQAGEARIWDAATGAELIPPLRHPEELVAAFSPDGRRVLTASRDRTARVWDAATGKPLTEPLEHSDEVLHAAFSPDGSRLLTVCYDQTVRLWSSETGLPLTRPLAHAAPVQVAIFSGDGRLVLTVSGFQDRPGVARVWEAATGIPLTPPLGHSLPLQDATFSPDGRQTLTITRDGQVRIWDLVPDARPVDDLLDLVELLAGHRVDATGTLVPLDASTLAAAWETRRARFPAELGILPRQGETTK